MSDSTKIVKWQGANTKLSKALINQFNAIADDESNAVLSDEELCHVLNEGLKPEQRISYTTFKNWKNGTYIADSISEEALNAFLSCIKRLRIHQKKTHINAMLNDEGAGTWQRRAWLLERKFDDLNLTIKHDHTSDGQQMAQFNFIHPDSSKEIDADDAEIIDESP